ncbi:MAG: DNA polymerase/3'-5' exonuclease PolX [Methanoregula sp.]|nr:DNA polymerase/3'-5' exonuclease PolX [Methanoregula sp.]
METPIRMTNKQIAAIFYEVADLLEIKSVTFKPVAYRRAAHVIETLQEDITSINERGKLEDIPGVGIHIAAKIREIIGTGKLAYLEKLKKEIPKGVLELAEIEGIGPKKALILSRQLGITNKEELKEAAKAQKIRDLPGFGEKSEKNILLSIQTMKGTGRRFLLGDILPVAEKIKRRLADLPQTQQISLAGSIRRRKETIGDVDILAASAEPEKIMTEFCTLPEIDRILGKGPTKSSIVLTSGVQVDLRVVDKDQYWTALQYFTGSKAHNIAMRRRALDRNWRLNEYGVTDLFTGKKLHGQTEQDLYRMLDLRYIEPEMREDRGEIEAAINGTLPEIVPYDAVKGDLHVHSSWSGGKHTIKELAEAAKAYGYEYIAICDHAWNPQTPHGLDEGAIAKQQKEIEQANRDLDGIVVLTGIECSIDTEGNLDIGNKLLGDLDVVVASVHSGLNMPKSGMTKRVLAALHNDRVDILGHPTGRIIQQRDPVQLDLPAVFDAAAELGVALEINAFPARLDLSDTNCKMAREHGARFSIGSDAHTRDNLGFMELGIATARRGWLEDKDIINTLHLQDLLMVLES